MSSEGIGEKAAPAAYLQFQGGHWVVESKMYEANLSVLSQNNLQLCHCGLCFVSVLFHGMAAVSKGMIPAFMPCYVQHLPLLRPTVSVNVVLLCKSPI